MSIKLQINKILQTITRLEQKYYRPVGSVKLIAVSKGYSVTEIKEAIQAGQRAFAESYLQQSLTKITLLKSESALEWHFIGRIQSNKTKSIANVFDWVHSVDRYAIAELLNRYRSADLPRLNVCLQVNVSEESSKAGLAVPEILSLAQQVITLPRLRLRGLMAISATNFTVKEQRMAFNSLRQALEMLNKHGLALDSLSMGMSGDYEAAIAEGATMIRLGTAIFGSR